MTATDSSRISPTAYYTGHVWCRHGLSPAALDTEFGRRFFNSLHPLQRVARSLTGGLTLEDMLVQRHRVLDHALEQAITSGRVQQVIEIASGVASRSLRFVHRHPHIRYIEADLPSMIAHKQRILERAGQLHPQLELHVVDALETSGSHSLEELARTRLRPDVGTAIITEGLLSYFPWTLVSTLLTRIRSVLQAFPSGVYLADLHLAQVTRKYPVARLVRRAIGAIVRGKTFIHFRDPDDADAVFRTLGFADVTIHAPETWATLLDLPATHVAQPVHVVQAWV